MNQVTKLVPVPEQLQKHQATAVKAQPPPDAPSKKGTPSQREESDGLGN